MNGSTFFLKCVAKLGISNVFGIVGGEAQAINFNEIKEINFYLTRHEFTAGVMADVYARITGKPQICYSTFGPGLTNLSTGIFSAIQDRSPVIAVSAQIDRSEVCFNQTHQCLNNVELMKNITKHAVEISDLADIPQILIEAISIAINNIPGPVYISFPLDLMKASIDDDTANKLIEDISIPIKQHNTFKDNDVLGNIASKINNAKNPIAIIGNQIIRENLCDSLEKFISKTNIPTIATLASKGIISENHPCFIGAYNKYIDIIYKENITDQIFQNCDLILLIGYDFGEDLKPSLWQKNIETVLINQDYNHEVDKIFTPNIKYLGNLQYSLDYLQQKVEQKIIPANILSVKNKINTKKDQKIPLIIQSIRKALGEDGILCSDIGIHKQYAGLLSKTYKPNTFMCSNVCGSFGFGLPAALGAQIAMPNNNVCLICGDGGFHSGSQDIETAIRYNLPIVIVILKDNAFGLIKQYQLMSKTAYDKNSVEFGNVDFVQLANANGMDAISLNDVSALENVINNAFSSKKSLLIEIPIEYDISL